LTPAEHRIQGHADVVLGGGLSLPLRHSPDGLIGNVSQVDCNSGASGSWIVLAQVRQHRLLYQSRMGRACLLARAGTKLRAGPRHHDREMAGRQGLAVTLRDALGGQVAGEFCHRPSGSQQRLDFTEDVGDPTLQQCALGTST